MRVPNLEHEISGWERYYDRVQVIRPTPQEIQDAKDYKRIHDHISNAFALHEDQIGKLCGRDN